MFFDEIPEIVHASLLHKSLDANQAVRHVETVEDADALRSQLDDRGLAAFVADDSILPRESGVSDKPLKPADMAAAEAVTVRGSWQEPFVRADEPSADAPR